MIVCSCNVFSEAEVRSAIANQPERPRMSRVYASLGCAAQCGGCVKTIKAIISHSFPSTTPRYTAARHSATDAAM